MAAYTGRKVVLAGLGGTGKTWLLKSFFEGFSVGDLVRLKIGQTQGLDTKKVRYKNLDVSVMDLGGQSIFRELWHKMTGFGINRSLIFSHADLCIFLINASEKTEFPESAKEIHRVINSLFSESPEARLAVFLHQWDLVTDSRKEKTTREFIVDFFGNPHTLDGRQYLTDIPPPLPRPIPKKCFKDDRLVFERIGEKYAENFLGISETSVYDGSAHEIMSRLLDEIK